MTETVQPLLSADPVWNSPARELAIRMRVAASWPYAQGEQPACAPVTEEQAVYCPIGSAFDGADLTTTRIGGYSDGWLYEASVTTSFKPADAHIGNLKMTVAIETLTWVGPQSVAHTPRGVFDLLYSEDVVLRCVPASA